MTDRLSLLPTAEQPRENVGVLNTRGKQAFFLSIFLALLMAFVVFVVLFALAQSELNDSHDANAQYGKARPNVVFFIADGFGPESATYIRTMTESRTIPLDDIISGSVQTFSADNRITDSAAGATAYSCTKKTLNDAVGVLPDMTPCGTLMEAAKLSGHWKTGVVTTARITHATPAAWTAHVGHRDQEEEIALQQATDQHVDLLFGGGLKFFVNRSDSQDLFQVMRDRGYTTASNYSQFLGLDHHDLPLIGLFAPDHIAYEIDRVRENPIRQPSLLQMTQKALELLTADTSKPFFLMVEAGKIDLAEHVHDAAAEYWELQQYMETIKLVQNFVSSHPNTIVIAVADHETGGISLGAEKTPYQYPEPYAWEPSVISAITASSEAMSFMIRGGQDIRSVFSQYANINDVTDLEVASVQAAIDIGKTTFWISTAISDIVAVRAKIGWTTPGHTGGDINLHTFGRKISGLQGNVQNIRVGELLMHALGLGPYVQDVTQELQDMYSPTRPAHKVATSQPREYWSHN